MAVREQRPAVNFDGYDDITNQGRYLLNTFVYERMQKDDIENAPDLEQLQGPDIQRGPPMEHVREIGRALRFFGDDLDRDLRFQELVSRVPPDAEQQTLLDVAASIFKDGVFNWGRVVALFYFVYKVCIKALSSIDIVRNIINTIVEFMRRHVVQWILEHGGWEAILDHLEQSKKKIGYLVIGSLVVCSAAFLYHKYFG